MKIVQLQDSLRCIRFVMEKYSDNEPVMDVLEDIECDLWLSPKSFKMDYTHYFIMPDLYDIIYKHWDPKMTLDRNAHKAMNYLYELLLAKRVKVSDDIQTTNTE